MWAAGIITAEHLDPVAKAADKFSTDELAALLAELAPCWGTLSPHAVAHFVAATDRMMHPPPDPDPAETDAYQTRNLSFAILGDTVVLAGTLPRVEAETVMAAIDAIAERLRTTADHVPTAARRADALVELVNTAHATGALPPAADYPSA